VTRQKERRVFRAGWEALARGVKGGGLRQEGSVHYVKNQPKKNRSEKDGICQFWRGGSTRTPCNLVRKRDIFGGASDSEKKTLLKG